MSKFFGAGGRNAKRKEEVKVEEPKAAEEQQDETTDNQREVSPMGRPQRSVSPLPSAEEPRTNRKYLATK
jgi:hypothetical protein